MDFLADKIIACSEAVRKYWERKASDKYTVIYLPIDTEKFGKLEYQHGSIGFKNGKNPVLGIVSRLFPGKGHEYLIKAMPKILNRFPSTKLKIIGTGPIMEELKSLTKLIKLEDSILFTGFVEDLYSVLSSLDIFVLPSLTEGFPLSIMEALAVGLPVAATPVGGIPELIENYKTGILFAKQNSDAISEAIIKLLSDYESAKKMGERGRQKVIQEYSPQLYVKKLDDLYQDLLAQKKMIPSPNPTKNNS